MWPQRTSYIQTDFQQAFKHPSLKYTFTSIHAGNFQPCETVYGKGPQIKLNPNSLSKPICLCFSFFTNHSILTIQWLRKNFKNLPRVFTWFPSGFSPTPCTNQKVIIFFLDRFLSLITNHDNDNAVTARETTATITTEGSLWFFFLQKGLLELLKATSYNN